MFCSRAFLPASLHNYPLYMPIITRGLGSFLHYFSRWQESLWMVMLVCDHASQPSCARREFYASALHIASSRKCQILQAYFPPRHPAGYYLPTIGFYFCETHPFTVPVSLFPFVGVVNPLTLPFAFPFSPGSSCLEPVSQGLTVGYQWRATSCYHTRKSFQEKIGTT